MKRAIIAFVDVKSDKFAPVYAEFPVADSVVKEYMDNPNRHYLVPSARNMLGVSFDEPCISGVFFDEVEGKMDVAEFFTQLKTRWVERHAEYVAMNAPKAGPERPTIKVCRGDLPPEFIALLEHLAQR